MISLRVLVVDDEPTQRTILGDILKCEGHGVATAGSGLEAVEQLRRAGFDLVITDLKMANGDGLHVLHEGRRLQPELSVLLMTAFGTISTAVLAMKSGAYDFLQKPFQKDELLARVERVADRVELKRENDRLRTELEAQAGPRFLGESEEMRRLLRLLRKLAPVAGDVLLSGESGTGKELAARALHFWGPRASGPFVAQNCAAIPEGLAESELFGHEKGAFTHATAGRAGRFEQAEGGTLFLDEISSMEIGLQAKLLRVLQDRMVERVGSGKPRRVNVRVVAAANRDFETSVREGRLREDLYHRLNVHEVHLPPLRERGADIRLLAERFRDEAAFRSGVPSPPLSEPLLAFLDRYRFPGNVRELEHMMQKMVALSDGEPLELADLPASVRRTTLPFEGGGKDRAVVSHAVIDPILEPTPLDPKAPQPEDLLRAGPISFFDLEARLLAEAIRLAAGNVSEAARRLGLSYKTMRYRARKFGLLCDEDDANGESDANGEGSL